MAITTFTRQKTQSRPEVRGVVKDVSGKIVKNADYAINFSSLENTTTNRRTYPGSFDYTAYSSSSDAGDRFNGIEQYFNTIFETGTWFRNAGSETT